MHQIDSDGLMKVEVNGAIHRRPARIMVVALNRDGSPALHHAVPELYQGEVLFETVGSRIPTIVRVDR